MTGGGGEGTIYRAPTKKSGGKPPPSKKKQDAGLKPADTQAIQTRGREKQIPRFACLRRASSE